MTEIEIIRQSLDIIKYVKANGTPPTFKQLAEIWLCSNSGARYRVRRCSYRLPEEIKEYYAERDTGERLPHRIRAKLH